MSIDFEIPAEAKRSAETVRQWVNDECIPADKELDTQNARRRAGGKLRKTRGRRGCGARSAEGNMDGMGLGPLAQRTGADGARRKLARALRCNTQGPDDASILLKSSPMAGIKGRVPQAAVDGDSDLFI